MSTLSRTSWRSALFRQSKGDASKLKALGTVVITPAQGVAIFDAYQVSARQAAVIERRCRRSGRGQRDTAHCGASHPAQERDMTDTVTERIRANPKYQELRRKRNTFGWLLAVCMLVVYYGYISLIAFNKEFLSLPLGSGVTTIGVPIGLGVIVFTI